MKKFFYLAICAVALVMASCSKDDESSENPILTDEISYDIMPAENAKQVFMQEKLHEQITPFFIDITMQHADYPYDDWKKLALSCMCEPNKANQAFLDSIAMLQNKSLAALGIKLPIAKQTNVIDMKMDAFNGALAFTAGTRIYVDIEMLREDEKMYQGRAEMVMWHEMWHVISRNNPDLRRKMYGLLGFNVLNEEIEIPADVKKHILCNPDVERHDSYATFTINGKATDCMLMLYSKEDEYKEGMTLNKYLGTTEGYWLLALDSQTHKPYRDESGKWVVYNCTEASNFEEIMSNGNTTYCDDQEECMADNFTSAIINDTEVPNQKLLQNIRTLL